jgi:uncharacterized phage infection (PIP) family protein YhgE
MTDYDKLILKLESFIRKYYKNLMIKGGLLSFSLLLCFFLAFVLLEYLGHFDKGVRMVLFYTYLAGAVFVLVKLLLIPLFKLYKMGETLSYEQASQIIGKHFPEVQDKLLNTLQLKNLAAQLPEDSKTILEASIRQKTAQLSPVSFSGAIDFSVNKKYLKYALPPLLVFVLLFVSSPTVITESTFRIVNHSQHFEKQAPFQFLLINDSLSVMEQEDFRLELKLEGDKIPDVVFVEYKNSRFRLKKEDKTKFSYLFRNPSEDIRFYFSTDEFSSQEYHLKVLPKPAVINFEIALEYPAYTLKDNQVIRNNGDLVVPEGTKATWRFKTQNTRNLLLEFPDTLLNLSGEKNIFEFKKSLGNSESYRLIPANEFIENNALVAYSIRVIPDKYPEINVEERPDSLNPKKVYFRGDIEDDYGFQHLFFKHRFIERASSPVEEKFSYDTLIIDKNHNQDRFFYFWDLRQIEIGAGDKIEYYFEVWDNDKINGSKSSKSKAQVYAAPTLKELEKQGDESNKEIKKELDESLNEARKIRKELDKITDEMKQKKELNWQDKKRIEDLLNRQKELQNKIEKAQKTNERNRQQQEDFKKMDENMLQKQEQLQKLFDELMTDEMKELFRELEELLEQLDKDKLQEKLEEMKFDQKDLEKELDRTLEIFKQMEFQEKLNQTIEKLDKLKQEQEKLKKETEQLDKMDKNSEEYQQKAEELAKKQEELKEKFEEFEKDLEQLKEKDEALERSNNMDDMQQEREDIKQDMQDSQENMEKNNMKKSGEKQQDAGEKMDNMKQQLMDMQAQMADGGLEEDMDALRTLLENIIQLSFDQEDIMEGLKKLNARDPKYVELAQLQRKLLDDTKIVEDSLFALSKRIIQIESTVNKEIANINRNVLEAIELLTDRKTNLANVKQQYSMTSFNNLALLLDEALQAMQQQMASKMPGTAMCNKPGQGMPQPMTMEQMKEQMKQQMEKMKGMQDGGAKPGQKPGDQEGMGMPRTSEELAKMAAQQEALRKEIQRLSEELNKDGSGAGNKLSEIAKEMEEIEKDIVNKRIRQETINRQEDILTRLLEHEKAEREREYDDERKGNEAKDYEISNPEEFFEYKRKKQKEAELLKTLPAEMTQYYKNKVNTYFNKFQD